MIKAICNTNEIKNVSKRLRKFAFTQNEDGVVDLTPGGGYVVYGIRQNKFGRFFLVLTDTQNTKLPWWMPADFFATKDLPIPNTWQKTQWRGYGKETVFASPVYFDATEDIEDGTEKGYKVFELMKADLE